MEYVGGRPPSLDQGLKESLPDVDLEWRVQTLLEEPKLNNEPLNTEAAWEILFWSFQHSRGSEILQVMILEYLRRHFTIAPEFAQSDIPAKFVEMANQRRMSAQHLKLAGVGQGGPQNSDTILAEYQPILAGNIAGINAMIEKQVDGNFLSAGYRQVKLNFKLKNALTSPTSTLRKMIVESLLAMDYYYVCEKDTVRSALYNHYEAGKVPPGGEAYRFLFDSLKSDFEMLISEQRKVRRADQMAFTDISTGKGWFEETSDILYGKVKDKVVAKMQSST